MKGKGILLLCTFMMLAVFLWGSVAHSEDVAALNTAIQARGGKWVAGETSVSRLTPAQQASLVGLTAEQCVMTSTPTASPPSSLSVPTHFDWRDNGGNYVTSIKNQGNCGSCWAFASTGALESATLITTGKPNTDLDLSEQMLISCGNAGSCSGGYIDDAANYIRDTGLPAESCFPYGGSGGCGPSCPTNKIQNWHWVYHSGTYASADVLKSQLVTYGPLVTTMAVYVDFFSYASGIYTYPGGGYLAGFHAVIIVGYDDPGQYFIAKNSWGTGWGEQGYFRIGYSELTSIVGFGGRACGTVAYETTHANPTLSVSKAGTGSGTVTSYPDGINCGSTCSASYANGTLVTLTATPDALMTFAGWSGACSGTGTCTVTMDTAKSVTATFNLAGYTLWVQKAGGATGTVTSYPSGINCGSTCSANYATGSQVTLTATPGPNATFAGWVEACSGTGTCTVTMNATKSVAAYFNVAGYALSVAKSGTGTGTVTSSPSGINCGTTCSANYATNSQVTLTATPDPNVTFTGWSGACSGTGTCTVTMYGATSVTAMFSAVTGYTLSVSKAGTGTGTVTSSPSGINCGTTCSANYATNSQVTLTATPDPNVTFTGWSGACTGTGTCTVTMNAATSVTATFTGVQPLNYALSVSKAGTGTGTVTSNPSGINCGSTCTANYTAHTQVTLTATPDPNVTFTGWSGACSGTGTCTVTMNAGTSVTATFTGVYPSNNYTLTVVKAGAAPGTVTSSPAGIGCGWTCAVNFAAGTQVTLTATPYVNVTFTGWSGACSGTGTCTVTMDAAKSATATFSVSPNSAYYCYSPSYANYSYQTWLCNAMYHPTICYTINWQLTTCPQ